MAGPSGCAARSGIATVHAGNGLDTDLHEFLVTPQGQAYIIALAPVHLPGYAREVMDAQVQEIDIATGLVMFSWGALDHIPLSTSSSVPSSASE